MHATTAPIMPDPAWNATARAFPDHLTIPEAVAAAARRYPNCPAIVSDDGVMTHAELQRRTDQMARHLTCAGVERGHCVAILCDHIPDAVIGMLAVMKVGAAYVPLDPRWPAMRIRSLLAEPAIRSVLVDSAWFSHVCDFAWELPNLVSVVCVDVDVADAFAHQVDRDAVRDLWDYVAGSDDPLQAAGFNQLADRARHRYTPAEVDAYVHRVVDLVLQDRGDRCEVLEIGCGSGLIVRALAPEVDRYHATDPSAAALASIGRWAQTDDVVTTEQGFADEVLTRVDSAYDRIVLASVTQFMPSVGYLHAVITAAIRAARPDGRVVVADVVSPEKSTHTGLNIPAGFFESLPLNDPAIASVRILGRSPEDFAGDLAHRYDVVIERAAEPATAAARPTVTTRHHVMQHPTAPVDAVCSPQDIAYIIFTSGSTGKPKGVLIRHDGAINLFDWVNRTFTVAPGDTLLMTTSFAFDLSVYDMFGMLSAGGAIRLLRDADRAEPESLATVLIDEPVTFWDSAPAAMSAVLPFLELGGPRTKEAALRLVFLSGDWVPVPMPDRIRTLFPAAEVVALGGATECTVWSNYYRVREVDPDWPSIPYGVPIQNARYHVLDAAGARVPVGTIGDLYIAGVCVASGYAGDPALTAAKFVPDLDDPELTMYRTGDRAMWLPDGTMRFCGRDDHQVKIRGHRIELGEVQAALEHLEGVVECAVVAPVGPDGRTLAAYYVAAPDRPITSATVRDRLTGVLPPYAVPTVIAQLPALPVGGTGKVDRAALERMWADGLAGRPAGEVALGDRLDAEGDGSIAAGAPGVREAVDACWTRILGAPPITGDTSFFAAGGTSLAAARLAAMLKERFGAVLSLQEIFDSPTCAEIVAILSDRTRESVAP